MARQRDVVLIIGGLGGVLVIVVVDHAVEVHALGPNEDRLEAMDDEAVAAVRLIAVAPQAELAARGVPAKVMKAIPPVIS